MNTLPEAKHIRSMRNDMAHRHLEAFKQYFMRVIAMPAEKVRQTSKFENFEI